MSKSFRQALGGPLITGLLTHLSLARSGRARKRVLFVVACILILAGAVAPAFAYLLTLTPYYSDPPYFVPNTVTVRARATDGQPLSGHTIRFTRTDTYLGGNMVSETRDTDGDGYATSMYMGGRAVATVTVTAEDLDQGGSDPATCQFTFYGTDLLTDSDNDSMIADPYSDPYATSDEVVEMTSPGRVVLANSDDDNGNSTADYLESGTVAGENDLAQVNLICAAPASDYTVTLLVSSPASNPPMYPPKPIKVWSDATKGTLLIGNQPGVPKVYTIAALPTAVYVEGIPNTPSTEAVLDMILKKPDGTAVASDQVKFTVVNVQIQHPTESAIPVLISKRIDTGDSYPSQYQTADRKIQITASTTPAMQGLKVYFQCWDPDDASPYEEGTDGGDNHDSAGTLEKGSGYTGGSAGAETYVVTDANGLAKVDLQITDHAAGDNYVVTANPQPSNSLDHKTGNLVAWKRVYLEVDRMCRTGADLRLNHTPWDLPTNELAMTDVSPFEEGDSVTVFDADNPTGETSTITGIDAVNNTITLSDAVTGYYYAGYNYSRGQRGAAVAVPDDGYYELPDTELEQLTQGFGDPEEVEGTDGGCFVEYVSLSEGAGYTPFQYLLDAAGGVSDFDYSRMWFSHFGQRDNYVHVVTARRQDTDIGGVRGTSYPSTNYLYLFVGAMEDDYPNDPTSLSKYREDVLVHEMGHQFCLAGVDNAHAAVHCHSEDDLCMMDWYRNHLDDISEFCLEGANHLAAVRAYGNL